MAFVYFMRETGVVDGPVKIGWSRNPMTRVEAYNTISPHPLEIVAKVPGEIMLENRIHMRFAHLRYHHEWFHSAPDLEALIVEVRAGTFDPEGLPTHKNPIRSASAVKGWAARVRTA